ncbi:MAG: hypothetical protein BroJett029_36960 [Alphaproteobacteria bacterium]|nr:MAG: hypothetical protein BroJett029_36960 [Alphaproteobacteria bacterium]
MAKGFGGFLIKAAGAAAAAAGAAAVYRAGRNEARIDERINPILDGTVVPGEVVGALPVGGNGNGYGTGAGDLEPGTDFIQPGALGGLGAGTAAGALAGGMTGGSEMAGGPAPDVSPASGVVLYPGDEQAGPLVPMSGTALAVPEDGAVTPAAAYATSKAGRRYALGGNILGAALGLLTVLALILGGIAAVQRKDSDMATLSSASAGVGDDGGGASDFDTSGSASGSADSSTDGSFDSTGSSSDTSGGASSSESGGGGSAGGSGGGGSGGGGGSNLKRPPDGQWAATGQGSEKTSPTPGKVVPWSNMSFAVKSAGDGDCWLWTWKSHAGRWAELKMCPTSDGGLVMAAATTYNIVDLGITKVYNLSKANCDKPHVMLPSNPAPGMQLSAGNCYNSNQECGANFTNCKASSIVSQKSPTTTTIKVIGSETVAGQQAWHIEFKQVMVPENPGAPGWVKTFEPHNTEHHWFRASDGMPLRHDRDINSRTLPAGALQYLGETTFTEKGSMVVTL